MAKLLLPRIVTKCDYICVSECPLKRMDGWMNVIFTSNEELEQIVPSKLKFLYSAYNKQHSHVFHNSTYITIQTFLYTYTYICIYVYLYMYVHLKVYMLNSCTFIKTPSFNNHNCRLVGRMAGWLVCLVGVFVWLNQ